MCRFLVYKGSSPILLSSLILKPSHSILHQSFDCRLRLDPRRPHNGDGFGIGHYTENPDLGPEPCVFKSTIPAWNCLNLERLASKTQSSLIFAHVRASTEGNLSEQNCHPFWCGAIMWMHNGGIGAWNKIKKALAMGLSDRWFNFVKGGTDSEWAFAIFLDCLEKKGLDPEQVMPPGGLGHDVLRGAMLETIERINALIAAVPSRDLGNEDRRSLLNFAVTDGHSVICTRYVNSKVDAPASLFWSSGTCWAESEDEKNGVKDYKVERRDKGADVVLVASEPLTFERDSWVTVPVNSMLTIHKQTVMIHPILDEFYTPNSANRSSTFAQTKGQTVTDSKNDIITTELKENLSILDLNIPNGRKILQYS
ncbi:N-terminal nucleophile aminohydrolase [Microthyrium microscopicum]|uniref:N-terminal nucleophile aminohydrolase n=1 Tax=Microthyrium microscopicum TaxID=703497 RepID=A0A6A6U2K2_9PEZI|nr:N-terminal nucleophile aminohydrolase [Microthyrium microscopicum]